MTIRTSSTRRNTLVIMGTLLTSLGGCSAIVKADDKTNTPFVVTYHLQPGAEEKIGLQAITDSKARLFAGSILSERSGGLNSHGGLIKLPQWVQVSWRKDVTTDDWTTGTVIGDYRVEVINRIPEEVFRQIKAAPRRVLKLHFLIKDDGVLFAWSIEVPDKNDDILHGGDFKLPTRFNGKVTDPGYGWKK